MSVTLPPGPRLPGVLQAAQAFRSSSGFLRRCHERYGDRFTVRIPGMGRMVYLVDPADVRMVLRGDPAVFRAGEANAPLSVILGRQSVLVVDGEKHRRSRRLMTPAFHGDSVRRQVQQMVDITVDEIASWPLNRPFRLLPSMQAITLEVILRTVIGVRDESKLAALRAALPSLVDLRSPMQLLLPEWLRRIGPWRRLEKARAHARSLLRAEIASTRVDPALDERTDVLAMLVRTVDEDGESLADDELCDQLVTLLLAGHETTATGLAWTFERLTRDPERLCRAVEAADSDDNGYLDAVCTEILRARPVVYEIGRVLAEPIQLGEYRIPAGVMLVPSIALVHNAERIYPEADEFRPERFLDTRPDPSAWFPFGGGTRRCLGATFATVEMRTVLREILRRVELATTDEPAERPVVRHVTLVPAGGAVVTARAMRPAEVSG